MDEEQQKTAAAPVRLDEAARIRVALKVVLSCVGLLGLVWGLYALRTVLLLLVLSLLLSYLLEPIVQAFDTGRLQWGRFRLPLPHLPRLLTVCLLYLLGLAVLIALLLFFLPILLKEGGSLIQSIPLYVAFIQETTEHLASLYQRYNLPTAWQPFVQSGLTRGAQTLLSILETVLGEVTTALAYTWWLLLPPLLAFFLLKDSRRLRHGFFVLFPATERGQRVAAMLDTVESVLATFIRTQLALCVLMGAWIFSLLTFLGIPYSFLLGLLAAVLEFIPVFGPLAAGVIICLIAAFRDPFLALWVLLALALLRLVQDYIVVPRVMGQHIDLHPAVIIIAVLCGAELAGTAGVFLATPAAAILKVLILAWNRPQHAMGAVPAAYDEEVSGATPSSSARLR